MRIAGLVLAAGESSRLGRSKQLVKYQGKTLMNHAIHALFEAGISDVYVVLGSQRTRLAASIDRSDAITIYNDKWREGIGSSLVTGVKSIAMDSQIDAVLMTLSDQPMIPVSHLNALINSLGDEGRIACSEYNGISGVPAIFPRDYFSELKALEGDEGAQKVIEKHSNNTKSILCPAGSIDIDTPADLSKLI